MAHYHESISHVAARAVAARALPKWFRVRIVFVQPDKRVVEKYERVISNRGEESTKGTGCETDQSND